METRYFTKKGSIYIQKIEGGQEFWIKKEKDGEIYPLAAAVHLASRKLKELVKEYPSSLLDRTYCFETDVEKEFLEDAKNEAFIGNLRDVQVEQTVICFIIKSENKYKLGYSSLIEKMEESA